MRVRFRMPCGSDAGIVQWMYACAWALTYVGVCTRATGNSASQAGAGSAVGHCRGGTVSF